MLRIPRRLFIVLCAIPVALSLGIALCVNFRTFFIMMSLTTLFLAIGLTRPIRFIPLFLFVLPLTGFIHNILKTSPVPLLLPIPFIGLIARTLKEGTSDLSLPTPVRTFMIATFFSIAVAVKSFLPFIPHWSAAVNSAPWGAVRLSNALGWVTLFALIALSGIAFFQLIRNSPGAAEMPHWIGAALAGCVLSGVLGLLQFAGWTEVGTVPIFALVGAQYNGTFLDPNASGIFSALLVPLWIYRAQWRATKFQWFTGMSLLFLLMISDCRSGFLLLFVSLTLLTALTLRNKEPRPVAAAGLALAILGGLGYLRYKLHSYGNRVMLVAANVLNAFRSESLTPLLGDRYQLWRAGWVTFKFNPLFGTGIGTYLIRMPSYQHLIGQVTNDSSGNTYLHILAEQGVLGFTAFLWLIGSAILNFSRQRTGEPVPLLKASAFSSFAGLLVACAFGTHLLCFEVNMLFWLLLSVLLADPHSGKRA